MKFSSFVHPLALSESTPSSFMISYLISLAIIAHPFNHTLEQTLPFLHNSPQYYSDYPYTIPFILDFTLWMQLYSNINDNLEQQLKLLYDYWFVQFDFPDEQGNPYRSFGGKMVWNDLLKREIPATWGVSSFEQLCNFRNGINYDKSVIGDKIYRIVNVRNITSSSFLLNSSELDEICLPQLQADKYCITNHDIIVARSGTPGATRLLLNPCDSTIFSGFIICCSPINERFRLYMTYHLKKLEGTSATKTGGSILQNVSQDTLKALMICVPPNEIIEKYNEHASKALNTMQKILSQNQKLARLRDWLLPMLMNGQATIDD